MTDWIEIRCPKCEGTGEVFKYDTAVFGKVCGGDAFQGRMYKCETCRGAGALLARPLETKPLHDSSGGRKEQP